MADDTTLLVPVHVDALLVNQFVATANFERWSNKWINLNAFLDPVPPPLSASAIPSQGVQLHWQLPSALTHGKAPKGSSNPVFPFTPNRWIVVRLAAASQSATAQSMTAWIIESDFYDPAAGTTPYVDPGSTPTNLQPTLLGRHTAISQWSGEANADGRLFLTATGIAQTSFLAYQPGLLDVYSFFDDTTLLLENTCLTYLVAGWYSNASSDPLVLNPAFDADKGLFTDLNWLALGLSGQSLPARSIYHGLVNDLLWQTSSAPARIDPTAESMQVAVGYTAIDALAAVLANSEKDSSPTPGQIEMMLAAFQYDSLTLLDEPDATAQLELRIRQAWFGATPGGTLWEIIPAAQGRTTPDRLSRVVPPPTVPLTTDQAAWLAALNTSQRAFDIAQRELMTLQSELFALWWKTQFADANLMPSGLNTWGINVQQILTWLANQLDTTQSASFISQVAVRQSALAQMQAGLPVPTSPSSIDQFSAKIPGNPAPGTPGNLLLKPNANPPFYHPVDPVLFIGGITPPVAPDNSQPLPCRLSSAATTGVNVVVNGVGTPVSASTGKLASFIQQPGTLPASGGQPLAGILDPAVAAALAALSTEAFFADPNNATSISQNGLSNSDSTVARALQTAMSARTAQTASIPDPLQAVFAFALWQQAWAPLYLEWALQFYPTVQASLTGQPLPPQAALSTGAQAVQDNLPMDLADWSFNGSPNVFERGSEYYSWAGGDIWAQTDWLHPQEFQGRSTLTPNAETLFLAKLAEFISKQPVASATAVVIAGAVTSVSLDSVGAGYSTVPAITFSGGDGLGAAATAEIADGVITAINITSGGSGYTTPPQVAITPGDWAAIQSLIASIGQTRFLSQTLSGFNDNLVMKQAMHTLPPDPATAAIVGEEGRLVPKPSPGNVSIKFGQCQPFFFPARGGFFTFVKLQIVDSFGQVLNLLQANGNFSGDPGSFRPILGTGMAPDAGLSAQKYQVKQAPRVVQPSRVNLRWLDASNDSEEVFLSPNANPVCGWLVPNHLDHSIAFYNAAGLPLGELLVLMQTSGTSAVVWLPAPDSPASVSDPSEIDNLHLRDMVSAFTASGGGIPASERLDAFRAWFNSIDETLWTVDPPGGQSDSGLAVLIGRPLAVVRLQVGLELFGRPAFNQSWRDTFDLATPGNQASLEVGRQEAGFTALPFSIQIGNIELLDDGAIGYFANDIYTTFNAVHAAASPSSSYIRLVGGSNVLSLPFQYPNYPVMNLTILIDPLGSLHAITGALPVAKTAVPSQFYASALANMAVSFRIGPVLTSPDAIRVSVPSTQRGDWSWVWCPTPGGFQINDIVAATGEARLADSPPHLMEGWLVLTPPDSSKT